MEILFAVAAGDLDGNKLEVALGSYPLLSGSSGYPESWWNCSDLGTTVAFKNRALSPSGSLSLGFVGSGGL